MDEKHLQRNAKALARYHAMSDEKKLERKKRDHERYIKNKEKLREYQKEYHKKNKENINNKKRTIRAEFDENKKELQRDYDKEKYQRNKEKILEQRKLYRENNKEKIKQYNRIYRKKLLEDPLNKFKKTISKNILNCFKDRGFRKSGKTQDILGCSLDEFKLHIESKFEDWMTWDNRGLYNGELNHGWDIDHIIPISTAKTEEDIIRLNHYTNLQPLCSKINRDIKRDNV